MTVEVRNLSAKAGDVRENGFHPWIGRSPREGHDNPLQYSCLENLMDRGAWGATVRGFAQSLTRLKRLGTHTLVCFQLLTYIDVAVMVKVRVLRKIKFPHFLSF